MNLINDIQEAAVDSSVDLSTLLRKCKLLAARIRNDDLAGWVDHELNGYPSADNLPPYRVIKVQSFGNFYGPFGRAQLGVPIPSVSLPSEYREYATTEYLMEGASSLSASLESNSSNPNIQYTWSPDLIAYVGTNIYKGYTCLSAWKSFSRHNITGILDIVRNRILDFTISIEAEIPDASNASSLAAISPDRSQQIFKTVIMGSVGNLAYGSSDFSQATELHVSTGDFSGLRECLEKLRVSTEDIDELETILQEDGPPEQSGAFGYRTARWVGNMVSKALSGTWDIGTSVAADALKKAIFSYYGLG